MTEFDSEQDETLEMEAIGEQPVCGYWWTGTATDRPELYVVRVGYFHGDAVELVSEVIAHNEQMHDATVRHVLENSADVETVRNWGTAADMLAHASEMLNEELPTLLPLPYGSGILYFAGEVTEEQWVQIRALRARAA